MTLVALRAEAQRRSLGPIEVDVAPEGAGVIVRVWCDFGGERMMMQALVAEADVARMTDELAEIWLGWLKLGTRTAKHPCLFWRRWSTQRWLGRDDGLRHG